MVADNITVPVGQPGIQTSRVTGPCTDKQMDTRNQKKKEKLEFFGQKSPSEASESDRGRPLLPMNWNSFMLNTSSSTSRMDVLFVQSPPSKLHISLLQVESQKPSWIHPDGQPSAQDGTYAALSFNTLSFSLSRRNQWQPAISSWKLTYMPAEMNLKFSAKKLEFFSRSQRLQLQDWPCILPSGRKSLPVKHPDREVRRRWNTKTATEYFFPIFKNAQSISTFSDSPGMRWRWASMADEENVGRWLLFTKISCKNKYPLRILNQKIQKLENSEPHVWQFEFSDFPDSASTEPVRLSQCKFDEPNQHVSAETESNIEVLHYPEIHEIRKIRKISPLTLSANPSKRKPIPWQINQSINQSMRLGI
jgi:hypothetical protein